MREQGREEERVGKGRGESREGKMREQGREVLNIRDHSSQIYSRTLLFHERGKMSVDSVLREIIRTEKHSKLPLICRTRSHHSQVEMNSIPEENSQEEKQTEIYTYITDPSRHIALHSSTVIWMKTYSWLCHCQLVKLQFWLKSGTLFTS